MIRTTKAQKVQWLKDHKAVWIDYADAPVTSKPDKFLVVARAMQTAGLYSSKTDPNAVLFRVAKLIRVSKETM